jgi:acetyl-CoA acetyltransferase
VIGPTWPRSRVAIAGYAQTPIERHSPVPLGGLAAGAVLAAIGDAGLTIDDVDGLVTVSGLPAFGAHLPEDGITTVSVEWLAARLRAAPSYSANVAGIGQFPGALAAGV